ncbi:YadA-like family protein [Salmonella enterica]|nr:YadA-like family protein [Salmonella enterica]
MATGDSAKAEGKNSVALGAYSQAKNANEVNIGIWSGETQTDTRTLSGLKDGVNPDEAVNKGQLDTAKASAISEANKYTDDEIGKLDTKAQGYATTAQTAANKYTDDTVSKVNEKVLKDANTYTDDTAKKTLKTASENNERRALIAENNAVTRSNTYTDESSSRTLESANTYTNHRATQAENNAVARSNNYTDNRFGELKNQVDRNEKRLNAGIAGVTALSSIPYSSGNKFSYGIGMGNYQNGNAVAAGVQFRVSPSTNVRLNISWDSAGNNATGVGIAGGW